MNTTHGHPIKEDLDAMEDNGNSLRRRAFLGVIGAAGVAGVAPGCGDDGTATPAGPTDVGAASDWPARTWKLLCAQRLIVGRDEMGFYALSAVCTHQGCTVTLGSNACSATGSGDVTASGALPTIGCPCHASAFNVQDGARISGEAQRALPAYRVTITNGRVLVDRGTTVAGATRVAAT